MGRRRPSSLALFGRAARTLPGPAQLLLGLVVAAVGLWLVTRPVTSATVLTVVLGAAALLAGAGDLAEPGRRTLRAVRGSAWLLLGLAAVLVPGQVAPMLVWLLAGVLVVGGLTRVAELRSGPWDARLATALLGLSELVLAGVALLWPDVTLAVVAILFGIRSAVAGVGLAWHGLGRGARGRAEATATSTARSSTAAGRWPRAGRLVASALALALAVGLASLTGTARREAPRVDDFAAPPTDIPDEPGVLLRQEPFMRQVPAGARAWRILHTTTDHDGTPTVATAIVVVPDARPVGGGASPVVAWAHGTTGQAVRCAPSLLEEPFTAGAFPEVMDEVVARGWTVVASDYVGLGAGGEHAYLVGRVAGQAVLDAVRAARELETGSDSRLADETVVWGHSQGGAAALWTAQVQPTYAPDVPLAGTVAMAPASDPLAVARALPGITGGQLFASLVVQGYASAYDDVRVEEVVRPAARTLVRGMAERCLAEPGVLASLLTAVSLGGEDVLRRGAADGPLGRRLAENVPLDPGPGPLLVVNGAADTLIAVGDQRAYVRRVRAAAREAGRARDLDFRVVPGEDHLGLVQAGSPLLPELVQWTEARFGSSP